MGLSSGSLLKIASTGKDAMMHLGRVDSTAGARIVRHFLAKGHLCLEIPRFPYTSSIVFDTCLFLAGRFQHHPLFGA